jgi:DNA replication protein DnaC
MFTSLAPPRYQDVSLDSFEVAHKGQRQILDRVRALASRLPDSVAKGESVVWFGSPGAGKDHLMFSLLRVAVCDHGMGCEWLQGNELWQRLRKRARGEGVVDSVCRSYSPPAILAVSDPVPPGADPRDWELNGLFGLVDWLYSRVKPIWMTVNVHSEEELAEKLTMQVYDRLRHGGHFLPCFWPSYRGKSSKGGAGDGGG